MLGKLVKRDLWAQLKIHAGIYLLILLLSVLTLAFWKLPLLHESHIIIQIIKAIVVLGLFVAMMGAFFVTFGFGIFRYRNNLLKDEGYLMHTLPVTNAALHFSKMIATTIYYLLDTCMLFIMISIISGGFRWITYVLAFCKAIFGYTIDDSELLYLLELPIGVKQAPPAFGLILVLMFFLYLLICIYQQQSMIYASLAFGYTASANRDLMSFVAYFIINFIIGIFAVGLMIATAFTNMWPSMNITTLEAQAEVDNYFLSAPDVFSYFLFISVISLIIGTILNVLTIYVTNHKLNLE